MARTLESTQERSSTLTPDAILTLGRGFWGSKTLLSAVELGLFTELAKGPQDGKALSERLGLHPRSAQDFLDALVALGMLERTDHTYRNTPETDLFLDRAKPTYVGGLLEVMNTRLYGFWGSLTEALRTGKPQNEAKHGEDFFATLYSDPSRLKAFLKAMTSVSLGAGSAIAEKFPWSKYRVFYDVGAAEGGAPVQIARRHSHLTGGGFDLPAVRPHFEEYVREHGLADRLRFVPGDFFQDPLPQADVLVMGHILHDWNLEEKKRILSKAHSTLNPGGALIVYDTVIDDERRENVFGLLMSLNMLIETPGGFDYTGADCVGWMREAGFRDPYVEPLAGSHSMVVGFK
jgi:O-methyltransferase domain/Dimerisation domain